jgi:hypothetical protein
MIDHRVLTHNEAGALAPCKRQQKLQVEKAETLCTQKYLCRSIIADNEKDIKTRRRSSSTSFISVVSCHVVSRILRSPSVIIYYIKRFAFALPIYRPLFHNLHQHEKMVLMPDALVPGYVKSGTTKSGNLVSRRP